MSPKRHRTALVAAPILQHLHSIRYPNGSRQAGDPKHERKDDLDMERTRKSTLYELLWEHYLICMYIIYRAYMLRRKCLERWQRAYYCNIYGVALSSWSKWLTAVCTANMFDLADRLVSCRRRLSNTYHYYFSCWFPTMWSTTAFHAT